MVQQVFGIGGVNDAVYRRSGESSSASDYNALAEGVSFFDKSFYQLCDAQGSIVSVIAAEPMQMFSYLIVAPGRTLETLDYDPYGRSRRWAMLDFNHDGVVDSNDASLIETSLYDGGPISDFNEDGVVDLLSAA